MLRMRAPHNNTAPPPFIFNRLIRKKGDEWIAEQEASLARALAEDRRQHRVGTQALKYRAYAILNVLSSLLRICSIAINSKAILSFTLSLNRLTQASLDAFSAQLEDIERKRTLSAATTQRTSHDQMSNDC